MTQPINHEKLAGLRQELGANFTRILGYFAEDGRKSISQIEQAVRARDAVALVRPAHTLKGESLQFGADELAELAEKIEMTARSAVEDHVFPADMLNEVIHLRPMFEEAHAAILRDTATVAPIMPVRRPVAFGRKVA